MSQLDGYSLQFPAPPGPSTISISYSTDSQSRSPKSLKRKRSETSMTVTAVTVSVADSTAKQVSIPPVILPDIHHNPDEPYVSPPSPVPTEIIDETVDQEPAEERMAAAKAAGVKVRDFAYEPLPKGRDPRAPEVWMKPLESLVLHDRYIRIHPTNAEAYSLPGKVLYNLLSTGLVTKEEAKRNWRASERKAANEYASRPLGPYPVCIPKSFRKPTAAYRTALRKQAFNELDDDVPEEVIYVPPDEPGMDDGPARIPHSASKVSRILPSQSKTSASAPPPTSHNAVVDAVHVDKRRRVSGNGIQASSSRSATPPAGPSGPSRVVSQTLSRSASFQARSTTPPHEDVPAPARPARTRGLARTQTVASISVR